MRDTGKASDAATVHVSVTDRLGRTHMYGYSNVMRMLNASTGPGDTAFMALGDPEPGWRKHTIEFFCREGADLVDVNEADSSLVMKLTNTVMQHKPKIMENDDEALAEAVAAASNLVGCLLAGILLKFDEKVLDVTIAKIAANIKENAIGTHERGMEIAKARGFRR